MTSVVKHFNDFYCELNTHCYYIRETVEISELCEKITKITAFIQDISILG
jgi:hypothetical protein